MFEFDNDSNLGVDIFKIIVFDFAILGCLLVLAGMFNKSRGINTIPIVLIKQLSIYIGGATFILIVSFTDILSKIVSFRKRVIGSVGLVYIGMLVLFSDTRVNPFSSWRNFVIDTFWYLSIVTIIFVAWYTYSSFLSNKYMKYLNRYQEEVN